jgi:sigma-54 specific flagellar transcriptional regulator A
MLGEKYVLLVEDNPEIKQATSLIFHFMGEQLTTLTYAEWKRNADEISKQGGDLSAIIFGSTQNSSSNNLANLEHEMQGIKSRFSATAVLTLGQGYDEEVATLDDNLKRRVLTQLPYPFCFLCYSFLVFASGVRFYRLAQYQASASHTRQRAGVVSVVHRYVTKPSC